MRAGLWVLAGLFGLSAASAYELHRRLEAERERSAALQARVDALEHASRVTTAAAGARASVADERTAESGPAARPPATTATTTPGASAPEESSRPADRQRAREMQQRQRQLWKDPEYRAAMAAQNKASLRRLYGDAARELGLSPVEMERLLDALATQRLPDPDAMDVSLGPEGRPDEDWLRRTRERDAARRRAGEAELRALLGDERYARWQEVEKTTPARIQAERLRMEVSAAGVTLDRAQEASLARLLADEERRVSNEVGKATARSADNALAGAPWNGTPAPKRDPSTAAADSLRLQRAMLDARANSNDRIREAAATFLSAEQLDAFMQQREAAVTAQRVALRVREAQRADDGDAAR